MIKAVFFDIDGTLVSFKTHRVPSATTEALMRLRRRGIMIFIATGRSELLIDNVDKSLFDGLLTYNGQYCRTPEGVIYSNPIPAPDVQVAVEYTSREGIACLFEGGDFMILNTVTDSATESARMLALAMPAPQDPSAIADREIMQLIFFGTQAQEDEMLRAMPSCEGTRWNPLFVDVIPRGGGKHVGMEKMLEYFGIAREESMAFGDGENDMSMLRYAGVGVAMGNASDMVKSAADYVTLSVDDEGIPAALRHFNLI